MDEDEHGGRSTTCSECANRQCIATVVVPRSKCHEAVAITGGRGRLIMNAKPSKQLSISLIAHIRTTSKNSP